jgi:hypothetical protein
MAMNNRLLRPRASGGFSPEQIAGLLVWLDGSDSSTLGDTSTGPGGTSNNGPVRYWGDKSGNGNHAINTSSIDSTPTMNVGGLAGKSFLAFDGGDGMWGPYGSGTAMPAQTTFVVTRFNSATSQNFARIFSQNATSVQSGSGTGESGGYIPIIRSGSTSTFGGFRGGVRAGVTLTSGVWSVFQNRFNAGYIDNRIGLNSYASESTGAYSATFDEFYVGSNTQGAGGGSYGGDIAEVLVYSASLADADADKVMNYLLKKWAL